MIEVDASTGMRAAWLALLAGGAGCGFTPLTNKVGVGSEAFVVIVGQGRDGAVDLFAAPAEGGRFYQFTFNLLVESNPTVGPSGTQLAFQRQATGQAAEVVTLNLHNGTERARALPPEAGSVERIGFGSTDDSVVVATTGGLYLFSTAGVEPISGAPAAKLDSLTYERLGDPGFASLRPCRTGTGWCVAKPDGQETALAGDASDPIRWGDAAMAYLRNGTIEIRPLGGGRVRQPTWSHQPPGLGQPSHHPGSPRR